MSASRGFTLLELLMATVLSALLMVGVLAVVADLGADGLSGGLSAAAEAASSRAAGEDAVEHWLGLLREDLQHAAETNMLGESEVELIGCLALDADRRRRTHRPVRVVYRIADVAGRSWLVRRQEALDVLTNRHVQRDLVCRDIRRFELVLFAEGLGDPADELDLPAEVESDRSVSQPRIPTANPPASSVRPHDRVLVNGKWYFRWKGGGGSVQQGSRGEKRAPPLGAAAEASGLKWAIAGNCWFYRVEVAGGGASTDSDDASRDVYGPDAGLDGGGIRGLIWRLRAWTGDGEDPDWDHIVTVQGGGG